MLNIEEVIIIIMSEASAVISQVISHNALISSRVLSLTYSRSSLLSSKERATSLASLVLEVDRSQGSTSLLLDYLNLISSGSTFMFTEISSSSLSTNTVVVTQWL